jgi:hypothetical protein
VADGRPGAVSALQQLEGLLRMNDS